MKRISYFFFLAFIISLFSTSCSNTKTYAQQLDDEQALIKAYIKRNNINVITSLPANKDWRENDYYKSGSGLYFHLADSGTTTDTTTIRLKYTVVPRYKQYTLSLIADTTINDWNTINFNYTPDFVYGDYTQSCLAFQEAVRYMKRIDSEAKLIVPSSLGFTADKNSVTPYGYTLKIKFLP